jgi:hypothetical protein
MISRLEGILLSEITFSCRVNVLLFDIEGHTCGEDGRVGYHAGRRRGMYSWLISPHALPAYGR